MICPRGCYPRAGNTVRKGRTLICFLSLSLLLRFWNSRSGVNYTVTSDFIQKSTVKKQKRYSVPPSEKADGFRCISTSDLMFWAFIWILDFSQASSQKPHVFLCVSYLL